MNAGATMDTTGEKSLSILLLAGDTTARKLTARILSRVGHNVHEAATSEAAVAAADTTAMDLLVLGAMGHDDVLRDGVAFLQAEAAALLKLPLVELAALGAAQPQRDCLPRPLDPVLLLEAVRAHARCAPNNRHAVDRDVLEDLLKLGGRSFVAQVIAQFLEDTAVGFTHLAKAVTDVDVLEFQNQAHAVRSCAANVGARAIYDLCLTWREIGAEEIRKNGCTYINQLKDECTRTDNFLRAFADEIQPAIGAAHAA